MATSTVQESSGYVDNWQSGKTLAECNLHMLNNEDSCDVTFRCGSSGYIVKAHRYMLISRSCVFHAMFSGPLAEKSDVHVPEIEAAIFKQFLIYIYTDNTTVDSDSVTALLYTARKYGMSGLETHCREFLQNSITFDNACDILEAAHLFDLNELYEKVMTLIKDEGERSLQTTGFLALRHDFVDELLQSDDLNANEEVIFNAVSGWAEAECKRQGKDVTPEAKRSILGDTLFNVRFPLMKQSFLVENVKCSELLTSTERLMLLEYMVSPVGSISPFNNNARLLRKPSKRRFFWFGGGHRCLGERFDSIAFKSNKPVHIYGYQLYGPCVNIGDAEYRVTSRFGEHGTVLKSAVQNEEVYTVNGEVFDVLFPEPVKITPERWYTLVVLMNGPDTWRGTKGSKCVMYNDGIQLDFRNTNNSTNGTCVEHGQIPSILFYTL